MSNPLVTPHHLETFHRDGYLFLPQLFDTEEMDILLKFAKNDEALLAGATGRKDASGQVTKLTLWNHPGEDLYSMFSRSPRHSNSNSWPRRGK